MLDYHNNNNCVYCVCYKKTPRYYAKCTITGMVGL